MYMRTACLLAQDAKSEGQALFSSGCRKGWGLDLGDKEEAQLMEGPHKYSLSLTLYEPRHSLASH